MRFLSETDVARLIDPALAIAAAVEAFRMQAAGAAAGPGALGRLDLRRPGAGLLALAGFEGDALLVKTNVHAHPAGGHRTGGSLVTLWDAAQARPVALIAAREFNGHRTAAGFAAAARLLAPKDASVLAVFGAGRLAGPTLRYLVGVRPIRRALIVGRTPRRAEALAAEARAWPGFAGVAVEACDDPAEAAACADIIATATTAERAVFPGAVVRPGTLVVLGGANRPTAREADDDLMRRAVIYPDHREGALAKAGDLLVPLAAGTIGEAAIGPEIGALLAGPAPALPDGFVSVFKSIGIASQDLVLAQALLRRAEEQGVGTVLDLEGLAA
jgi:ornithine cyclodeaminase